MNNDKQIELRIPTETGELSLSPMIVRKYLVHGQGAVTDQEIMMFLGLCKYQRLNPFLREAYLIKYGNQPAASIVVGKDAFLKRARQCPDFRGHKAGVIVQAQDGSIHYNDGFIPEGQKLIGGWAEVYLHNWDFPLRIEVSLLEYIARKSDGSINRMWTEKPATMIRKVALMQALREAFPSALGAMYIPEEVGTNPDELPSQPVVIDHDPTQSHPGGQSDRDDASQRRSRRNRFMDGNQPIITCGITPEQLLAIRSIMKSSQAARSAVEDYLRSIGYAIKDGLTYLRHDEAIELLDKLNQLNAAMAEHAGGETPEAPDAASEVICPMDGSTRRVADFCHATCQMRREDGWCPAIDDPPVEGGIL